MSPIELSIDGFPSRRLSREVVTTSPPGTTPMSAGRVLAGRYPGG